MANGQWPEQWPVLVTVERLLPMENSYQDALETDWFFAEDLPPDVYYIPQLIALY